MEKFSGPLGEQLEAHVLYLQDFFPRFFDLIDPESGPVKGSLPFSLPLVVALTLFLSRCCSHCIQPTVLEFYGSIRYFMHVLDLIDVQNGIIGRYLGCLAISITGAMLLP